MGQAKRNRESGATVKKKLRFLHLLRLITKKYNEHQILAFAKRRKL
jgi:hypothetical protein